MKNNYTTYVALLRGINVGGNNRIEMPKLKNTFEQLGFINVVTYINSGNIIFQNNSYTNKQMVTSLEQSIKQDFGLSIKVLVRDFANIKSIAKALPDNWLNDKTMKCDVMFLWDGFDSQSVTTDLSILPGVDDVKYISSVLLWRVNRGKINKSGMMKIVGTDLYKNMTVRNCNTLRKIYNLMNCEPYTRKI